jgi:site-specific DNA recombinase
MEIPKSLAQPKRCAVYTRKSFEPPIAQEVTSLESQRAICSAYIASQQHKGWGLSSKAYDDPGRSGSNLNRPALQELMADIETGLVDIVVVYKLDRITRTLLDFVRLIDFFDRFGVAFVSITQNFDTSDSMGRLIRNVLLTFAQFEREIASDRMRDKKMVMKQRGLWAGGDAPLGYDLRQGRLVVNKLEAPAIRCIFETYVETQRISAVHRRLIELGYRRKVWKTKAGVRKGGTPIGLSSLHHVLQNPVYIGEVTHNRERFPGVHEPILEREIWEQAQMVRKEREQFKPRLPRHILTGLIFDAYGRPMHAREVRGGRANGRYYASAFATWAIRQRVRQIRIRADPFEQLVLEGLKRLVSERARLRSLLIQSGVHGAQLDELSDMGAAAAVRLEALGVRQLSATMKVLLQRVEVGLECVRLVVRPEALAAFIAWDGVGFFGIDVLKLGRPIRMHVEEIPVAVTRERKKSWLPIEARTDPASPCPKLLALLADSKAAQALVLENRDVEIADLAWSLGRKPSSFSRLIRLNYLAPDIMTAIIDGTQPSTLTRQVLSQIDLPIDWVLQRRLLGFPPRQEEWRRDYQGTREGSILLTERADAESRTRA